MQPAPFPEVIDSTILASFRSCPRKAYLAYLQHYKPRVQSVHLHAGAAYAAGLEAARVAFFQDGKSEEDAKGLGLKRLIEAYGDFECPADSAKSLQNMCGALEYYLSIWPLSTDKAIPITLPSGKRGVEFSFVEPLEINHPETGNPILYSGRMDTIVEYAGGIFGEDDKTTSQLGAKWGDQWNLRSQFTGYCWGAQKAGLPLNGFLIRGVSILKRSFGNAEAITYRPAWQISRWYEQVHADLERMISCWKQDRFDYNLDHSCAEYGGCEFQQVCLAADPQPWLDVNFERRRWNPVTREEEVLE